MDEYSPYNNGAPQRQQYDDERDDFRRGGIRRKPMRDRGRRGDRFNDHKPYNRQSNRPSGGDFRGKNESFDKEASAKEKPCRTLFVRNVQYHTSENDVKALFDRFGEIKDVFNLIQNRGMIFVTYYDLRAAENAKNSLQDATLNDRRVDIHYSLPKEEEEKAKCDRSKNQGTLLYTLKNGGSELDDNELHQFFSRFGELKAIRVPHFKKSTAYQYNPAERNQQRLVEFYDSRACVAAYDATYDTEYKGGKWDVVFFWDYPFRDRHNTHSKRERNSGRDDDRGSRRRGSDRYVPPPVPSPSSSQYNDPRLQIKQDLGSDDYRLEKAQKAQQILSMLTHQQAPPPSMSSQYQPQQQMSYQPPPVPPVETPMSTSYQPDMGSTYQPVKMGSSPYQPQSQYQPIKSESYVPQQQQQPAYSTFTQQHPPENNQVQQLLSLLGQVQQQQQQPPQAPMVQQNIAPIPGMDPATALTQLAALLQQQQQQQNH